MASGTIMQPGGGAESSTNYIKFPDGTLIVFMRQAFVTKVTTAAGGMYTSDTLSFPDYPVPFISAPARSFGIDAPDYGVVSIMQNSYNANAPSTTNPGSFMILRTPANPNNTTYYVSAIAVGRWK